MLIVKLNRGESIQIGGAVVSVLTRAGGKQVLAIAAPKDVIIQRESMVDRKVLLENPQWVETHKKRGKRVKK